MTGTPPAGQTYKYRPYEGVEALRACGFIPRGSLGETCLEAERMLGCAPAGRLRTLAQLACAAAMLQRVRGNDGQPLMLVKGGLVLQVLLGAHARQTFDLDGIVRCEFDEFVGRAREALRGPWGCVSATIERARAYPGNASPSDLFELELTLSAPGDEPVRVLCNGTVEEPRATHAPWAYPALALDALGLPAPDALWGVSPAYCVADKLLSLSAPRYLSEEHEREGRVRPHTSAKHLVDAVWLTRLCEEGRLCGREELRQTLEELWAHDRDLRAQRGLAPLPRPLRPTAQEGWGLEYLKAAISCGLDLSVGEALAEVTAFMERIDP